LGWTEGAAPQGSVYPPGAFKAVVRIPGSNVWGAVQTISPAIDPYSVAINADDQGNAHAAWLQATDAGATGSWTSSYSASSGTWTAASLLPDSMANDVKTVMSPSLASNVIGVHHPCTWVCTKYTHNTGHPHQDCW
jgi:hypothetical protein